MVGGGRERTGERLHITTADRPVAALVTAPVFYDPEGARLDAA
jgi:sarcosine oxidase subunit alpha